MARNKKQSESLPDRAYRLSSGVEESLRDLDDTDYLDVLEMVICNIQESIDVKREEMS